MCNGPAVGSPRGSQKCPPPYRLNEHDRGAQRELGERLVPGGDAAEQDCHVALPRLGSLLPDRLKGEALPRLGSPLPDRLKGEALPRIGSPLPDRLKGEALPRIGAIGSLLPDRLKGEAIPRIGSLLPVRLKGR